MYISIIHQRTPTNDQSRINSTAIGVPELDRPNAFILAVVGLDSVIITDLPLVTSQSVKLPL